MSAYALSPDIGLLESQSERRFRRLLLALLVPALAAGIVIPLVKLSDQLAGGGVPQPRYAKLLPQAPVTATPEEPKQQPKTAAKPKPQVTQEQRVQKARQRAQRSGLLAQADLLNELRDLEVKSTTINSTVIASSSSPSSSSIARSATATSGGIGETSAVERQESATGLGERRTTSVQSPVGTGPRRDVAGTDGHKIAKGRTFEEIHLVFDRSKGAFYTMYTREQRTRPDMQGKVVVKITIAPSGRVVRCTVVSSDLRNPEFEKKIVARVMLLDFGAKDVGEFTMDYPIYFFPS